MGVGRGDVHGTPTHTCTSDDASKIKVPSALTIYLYLTAIVRPYKPMLMIPLENTESP